MDDRRLSAGCCKSCLRRSHLIGRLSPRIAALLGERRDRPAGLLGLEEDQLVAALAGKRAGAARAFLRGFDDLVARRHAHGAGVEVVCRHGDAYPRPLLALGDAPAALYVKGGLGRLEALAGEPAATVVGTRRASPYGLEVAQGLGRGLASAGVAVVSGLALGIDAAAHRGALAGGDRLVAVLACGVDIPYPLANRQLYERIVARGVAVSELPPGVPPMRWSFPARNRIMAALAGITVIVEADDPSGSLITGRHAEDLGRQVGAVPGRVNAKVTAGSNRLLREGAAVIRGSEDVLDELFGVGGHVGAPPVAAPDPLRSLDRRLRAVLEGIEAGSGVEAIAGATGLAPAEVRSALGRLELMGLIAREGLASYVRTVA